jgi:hypothetical protein
MKNFTRLFGVITLVAVILFSMAACNDGSSGSTGTSSTQTENPPSNRPDFTVVEANTEGRLTITGLDYYDGHRIFARRVVKNNPIDFDLVAADKFMNFYSKSSGITNECAIELGIITNGQVILKVCSSNRGYRNYKGNDLNVNFNVYVEFMKVDYEVVWEVKGTVTVINFVNGIGTGVFATN